MSDSIRWMLRWNDLSHHLNKSLILFPHLNKSLILLRWVTQSDECWDRMTWVTHMNKSLISISHLNKSPDESPEMGLIQMSDSSHSISAFIWLSHSSQSSGGLISISYLNKSPDESPEMEWPATSWPRLIESERLTMWLSLTQSDEVRKLQVISPQDVPEGMYWDEWVIQMSVSSHSIWGFKSDSITLWFVLNHPYKRDM